MWIAITLKKIAYWFGIILSGLTIIWSIQLINNPDLYLKEGTIVKMKRVEGTGGIISLPELYYIVIANYDNDESRLLYVSELLYDKLEIGDNYMYNGDNSDIYISLALSLILFIWLLISFFKNEYGGYDSNVCSLNLKYNNKDGFKISYNP